MCNYPDYCYTKIYKFSPTGSRVLTNPEPFLRYVHMKVHALLAAKSSEELLKVKLDILREFEQILSYDIAHTVSPKPLGSFNSEQGKKDFMLLHEIRDDLHLYLGNICLNYHTALLNLQRGFPGISSYTDMIDYEGLYVHAMENYGRALLGKPVPTLFTTKQQERTPQLVTMEVKGNEVFTKKVHLKSALEKVRTWPHAYSATFILPALIEGSLLARIADDIVVTFCQKIQELFSQNEEISSAEKRLYMSFAESQRFENIVVEPKSKQDTMEELWQYGCKRRIFSPNQHEIHDILLDKVKGRKPVTLGWLINSAYVKEIIRPEYLKLMMHVFSSKELNIRNYIMHAHEANFDYLSLGYAAIMMQLFWDIAGEDVFIRKILSK